MPRKLFVLFGSALLVTAVTATAGSPAGPRPSGGCTACNAWAWTGITSQAITMRFVSDLEERNLVGLELAVKVQSCWLASPAGRSQGVTQFSFATTGKPFISTRGGRFSTSRTSRVYLPIPSTTWHMTGKLKGAVASGSVRWALIPSDTYGCTPSSGSFTWTARRGGKVEDGLLPH